MTRTHMDQEGWVRFTMGPPMSTNQLFVNVPGRGRKKTERYRIWQNANGWELKIQKPLAVSGPVEIVIGVPPRYGGDTDNAAKCVLDLMVNAGLIQSDLMRIVRRLTIEAIEGDKTVVSYRRWNTARGDQ